MSSKAASGVSSPAPSKGDSTKDKSSAASDRLSDKSSKNDKSKKSVSIINSGEEDKGNIHEELRELREYVMNLKHQLKAEVTLELKERRASEDGLAKNDGSAPRDQQADGGFSAIRAPQVGMTPEQTGEFKKQILYVSTLQTKVKELETKLTETNKHIKAGEERLLELSELEGHNSHELYTSIDEINNSLSEKIALQRVEVQKLAGDLPKPINYDPFNYGEAYGGDLVDFQARKRIIELKCMLTSLRNRIEELQNKVSESPKVNLGYTIMRLDDILHSTGFDKMIKTGAASRSEVMLLTPPDQQRDPGRMDFPRQEIFQNTEEQSSKWAITDSIMQTMYRLETEVADLQKMIGTAGVDAQNMALNEMKSSIRVLKDTKIDQNSARKMIEEIASSNCMWNSSAPQQKLGRSGSIKPGTMVGNMGPTTTPSDDGRFISSDKFITVIRNVNATLEVLMGRVEGCEANTRTVSPRAAATRMTNCPTLMTDRNCLTCDTDIQRPLPRQGSPAQRQDDFSLPRLPEFGTRPGQLTQRDRLPPRIRHFLSSGYDIRVNNEVVGVFRVDDHPQRGTTLGVRPPKFHVAQPEAPGNRRAYNLGDVPSLLPRNRCNYYMKGKDNKVYQADPNFNHEAWVQEMKQKRDKTQNIEKEKRMQLSQIRRYQNEKLFTQIQYKGQTLKSAKKRDSAEPQSSATGFKIPSAHGLAGVEAYPTSRRMKPLATRLDYDAALCLNNTLIVVDFMAQWCINCKNAEPRLHDMADTFQQVKFYQLDVDQNEAVAEYCRVVSLPTYHVYLNKNKIEELVGANPDRLQQVLMKHLKTMPGYAAAAHMPTVEIDQAPEGPVSDKMEWEKLYDQQNEAASKIQKGMKGMVAHKKEKQVKILVQKQNKAATKIQSSFRGHLARQCKIRVGTSPSVQNIQFAKGLDMPGSQQTDPGFKGNKLRASPSGGRSISPVVVPLSNPSTPNPQNPTTSGPAPPPVTPREPEEEVDIDLKDPEVEKAALLIQKKAMFGKKKTPASSAAPSAPSTPKPDDAP